MPAIVIEFPTAEEEERSRRFQVHKNYLLGLSQHLQERYGEGLDDASRGLVEELRRQRGYGRIQCTSIDRKACGTALSLSWTGLIQLELASWSQVRFDLAYTNAWAPVHAYYAVHGAARAWLTAQGQTTTSHAATLKAIGSEVQGRHLYPEPWDVSCTGCCHNGSHIFQNVASQSAIADPGLLLQAPSLDTFWPRYLKMLETTRKQVLEQRYNDWKQQQGKKRITMAQKQQVATGVPPTTLFDFLWRLRVRSNYQDVESVLMTNVADAWHQDFHDSIRLVAHLSSLVFETLLAARIGRQAYGDAIDSFMKYRGQSPEPVQFLRKRRAWLGPKA